MREMIREAFSILIEPLRSRVYNIVSRGVLELAKDTEGMQVLKAAILADENRDDIEYFQDYGFTSVPKAGAEALVICPQGNRDHMIAVKVADRRFRLKGLAEGEVALYTDEGDKIVFKRGGTIEVVAATKLEVKSPLVELGNGTLEKILNGETFQTFFNQHKHIGNAGVPTGAPVTLSPVAHLSTVVKGAK